MLTHRPRQMKLDNHLLELLLQLLELLRVDQLVLQQQRAHMLDGVARPPEQASCTAPQQQREHVSLTM